MNELSETERKAVCEILVTQLSVQEAQLTPEARIQADLGADSLDVIEIVMAAEERFGISIPDETAERVTTVEELMEELGRVLHAGEGRRVVDE